MTDPRPLGYELIVDGEAEPLVGGMTLGRHLDNDLVIAGEDVHDFHLRIDVSNRGPVAVPLGEATFQLNGQPVDLPTGLLPGDRLEVGQAELELRMEALGPPEAEEWHLCPAGDPHGFVVSGELRIGREPSSDLQLTDLHMSRRHARIVEIAGSIWVQDLGSANGTFVNGERVRGARRLLHGDEVRFDQYVCQLLGRGADLTPGRLAGVRDRVPFVAGARLATGSEETPTAEIELAMRPEPRWAELPPGSLAGTYLVGVDEAGAGLVRRLPMGRTLIGRQAECDLELRDLAVSGRHAELILRAEGATLTDLMSTNGTLCNGRPIQSVRLSDGDRLIFGRTDLLYREIRPQVLRSRRLWLQVAGLVLAGFGAVLLLAL
jgi:pSer/pThr/pTyr-binding forkhead associated (FHA) protein